jgi:hypothetical protein
VGTKVKKRRVLTFGNGEKKRATRQDLSYSFEGWDYKMEEMIEKPGRAVLFEIPRFSSKIFQDDGSELDEQIRSKQRRMERV